MNERIERAAGGLVVRGPQGRRELLMIDDAYGKVSFPKGHLEPGESWEEAAVREIAEETGVTARIIGSIGRVEYRIERDGEPIRKQVRLFLLEAEDDSNVVHQAEEVRGAYFLPIDEAQRKHDEHGYANWSFVFAKAKALLAWLDGDYETRWRGLPASSPQQDIDALAAEALPVVRQLVEACREELRVTCPSISIPAVPDVSLPREGLGVADVRVAVESTLLKPEASEVAVAALCDEAVRESFPLVCINPRHVAFAASRLAGTKTRVCTVIGFPLGAATADALAFETIELAAKGASEIDMVIPIGAMVEDDAFTVFDHVHRVVQAARSLPNPPAIKVIVETSALSMDGVIKASLLAISAGADFVKTSTGFHRAGATLADVSAMALCAGNVARVKASGGVRTADAARQLMRYGADRLGTSSGRALVEG
ncbi:deoxyribose-phosphate aldolase [Alicyclobacillus acidiphilus]|uniref:deoxyribose-phosphate aldolase n=1 Tax=Alicyclobacillus acidiphilus TaxID=182455 RepID=UPI000AEC04A7|nr:deoxyribose-phosphate aldolase [Alicyclobacillus acidiphilus]